MDYIIGSNLANPIAAFIFGTTVPHSQRKLKLREVRLESRGGQDSNPNAGVHAPFNTTSRYGVLFPSPFRVQAQAQCNTTKEWEVRLRKYNLLSKLHPA